MRKISTYYLAALAVANCLLGWFFINFNRFMMEQFIRHLEGRRLPAATMLATSCPWWPFAISGLSALGAAISVATPLQSKSLLHLVIALLAAESFFLFWTTVAYTIPFVSLIVSLGK